MPDVAVKTLLDPTGPNVQHAVHGTRIAGRVAVTVYWEEIENALKSGLSISAIYRLLHQAGYVSVSLQSFARQVKARREGARSARTAIESVAEAPTSRSVSGSPRPDVSGPQRPSGPGPGASTSTRAPRPWLKGGPPPAPDPNAVFRPRDPLADD
jgi:hypothetical protein